VNLTHEKQRAAMYPLRFIIYTASLTVTPLAVTIRPPSWHPSHSREAGRIT